MFGGNLFDVFEHRVDGGFGLSVVGVARAGDVVGDDPGFEFGMKGGVNIAERSDVEEENGT